MTTSDPLSIPSLSLISTFTSPKRDSILPHPHHNHHHHHSTSIFNPSYLLSRTRWIRDILDPLIARQGPEALSSSEILHLDDFLRTLLSADLPQADLRYSRLHLAVEAISGGATRWPSGLVERCDLLRESWEGRYRAPLKGWGTLLYEGEGARLGGVCRPADVTREHLLLRWLRQPDAKLNPAHSRRCGDLGFVPGEWVFFSLPSAPSPFPSFRGHLLGERLAGGEEGLRMF
jgi:hypothetical protein